MNPHSIVDHLKHNNYCHLKFNIKHFYPLVHHVSAIHVEGVSLELYYKITEGIGPHRKVELCLRLRDNGSGSF